MAASRFLRHGKCPTCLSNDNLAIYSDGRTFCFTPGCGPGAPVAARGAKPPAALIPQHLLRDCSLSSRGISGQTCRYFGYKAALRPDKTWVQVAQYYRDGAVVAQKLRFTPKSTFPILGDGRELPLYGRWLVSEAGGRMIVVTEGEIDAMSVYEASGGTIPVVSLPNGAGSARHVLRRDRDLLHCFANIIVWFDDDDPGTEAVIDARGELGLQVKSVQIPGAKDANDALVNLGAPRVVRAIKQLLR